MTAILRNLGTKTNSPWDSCWWRRDSSGMQMDARSRTSISKPRQCGMDEKSLSTRWVTVQLVKGRT